VLLHQPIDPLGVDRGEASGSPLALEKRGDPPVPIARPLINQTPNIGRQFRIPGTGLGTSHGTAAGRPLDEVGAATPKVSAIVFTGYPPEATSATARSVFLPVQGPAPP
jgi:hypothetical protein